MLRPVEQVFGEIDYGDIDDCREDYSPFSARQSDQAPAQRSDAENGHRTQECGSGGPHNVRPGPVHWLPPWAGATVSIASPIAKIAGVMTTKPAPSLASVDTGSSASANSLPLMRRIFVYQVSAISQIDCAQ
jgi:hypothetical protein